MLVLAKGKAMNANVIVIIAWAALFSVDYAQAADTTADANWRQVRDRGGLQIWMRRVPDSRLREVRAETVIWAPADAIWRTLDDVENHHQYMPFVVDAKVVKRTPEEVLLYQRIDPPLVKQRDYGLRVFIDRDAQGKAYRRRFVVANEVAPDLPDNTVRVQLVRGYWELQPLSPHRTAVRYVVHTDPGGNVPKRIINLGAKRAVTRLLNAVREHAEGTDWASAGGLLVAADQMGTSSD